MKEIRKQKINSRNKNAITLIALVVTIVVLLILAGVSINLILDNNGIIEKSKEAKIETRASQVEDEIGMWRQNNFINSETNEKIENTEALLQDLLDKKLITEDEIDREKELITIKRKDKTVVKQISYENVKKYAVEKGYHSWGAVVLVEKNIDKATSFQKAYIMCNDEKIEISEIIDKIEKEECNCLWGYDIANYLEKLGKIDSWANLQYTEQTIIMEKDGILYKGTVKMGSLK